MEYFVEICGLEFECQNTLIICLYGHERETKVFSKTLIALLVKFKKDESENIVIGGHFDINYYV